MMNILKCNFIDSKSRIEMTAPKHNFMWGADYLLMDSNTFMGAADGSKYDNIIDTFMSIWKVRNYSILNTETQFNSAYCP